MALDNLRVWIEDALESNEKIPEPIPIAGLPSGKWVQRVPRRMHAELVELASKDAVSLNQFVVSVLAREIGYRAGVQQSQPIDLNASADPSTVYWSAKIADVEVSKTWRIDDPLKNDLISPVFVDQLVNKLPYRMTVKDRDIEKHAKETEHKNWN